MRLILLWGLGLGLLTVAVDACAGEIVHRLSDDDIITAVWTADLFLSCALYAWAGYRVGAATQDVRMGLEAAVLAGALAGMMAVAYHVARPLPAEDFDAVQAVELLAWNIVEAAAAGWLTAWLAAGRRTVPPSR